METTKINTVEKSDLMSKALERMASKKRGILKDLEDHSTHEKRVLALARYLESTLPKKILNRSVMDFDGWDKYVWITIRPKYFDQFTDHDTLLITDYCAKLTKWDFNKVLNGHSGMFNHVLERRYPLAASYEVKFQTIGNIDGCEVIEEEKTVTTTEKVFKVKC